MNHPLRIAFHNITPSAAVEENIRERIAKLDLICDRITGCRVAVEAPHRHHHKGGAFDVRIEISVPGREIVVHRALKSLETADSRETDSEPAFRENRHPSRYGAHQDIYVAIRDAFDAAARKLENYVGRRNDARRAEAVETSA